MAMERMNEEGLCRPYGIKDLFYYRKTGAWTAGSTPSKISVTMTGANTNGHIASESGYYNLTVLGWCLFASHATHWLSNTSTAPHWVSYQFPTSAMVSNYKFKPWSPDNFPSRSPRDWAFQGSNNGTDWTDLDTVSSFSSYTQNTFETFTVDAPAYFTRYRIYITATVNSSNFFGMSGMELWGW